MTPRRLAAAALFVTALAASPEAGVAGGGDVESLGADSLGDRRAALTARASGLSKSELARERYTLGLWARERGLEDDAVREFRAAIDADPDHEPSRAALGDVRVGDRWVAQAEAMAAKGMVRRDGAWVLKEEAAILDLPARERAHRREEQQKVDRLLRTCVAGTESQRKFALAALGTVDDRYKAEPMAYALRSRTKEVRLLAAKELGRLGDRRTLKPLVHRAIHDPEPEVREACVVAAKAVGDENLLAPFVKALGSESPQTRMNAAEGIAHIGDVRGIRYLVWRFEAHGGGGPRAYSFFGTQLSYIQDFDVEVASTAFIADPQVGVLQEGIVLDVQVVGTEVVSQWTERQVIHGALARLTHVSTVLNEPGAWAKWWKEHESEYTAAN